MGESYGWEGWGQPELLGDQALLGAHVVPDCHVRERALVEGGGVLLGELDSRCRTAPEG